MRLRYLPLALLLIAVTARAAALNCAITGTVQNIDGSPCPDCTVSFNSGVTQVLNGVTYQPLTASTVTDNNGNLTQISLPQGLAVQITVTENGQSFAPYSAIVPFFTSVNFDAMSQGVTTQSLNALSSAQPPTGPLSLNNQQITNLACPAGAGGALSWGCNATVNNLTVNGGFTQQTSGVAYVGRLTVTGISNPNAPIVVAEGTTGSTTYTYGIVCHDGNGGTTLESSFTTINNGNALLTSNNYNLVTFTFPASARTCDVLRSATTAAIGGTGLTSSPFHDTNTTTVGYAQPSRNTTADGVFGGDLSAADLNLSGNVSVGGTAAISGALNVNGLASLGSVYDASYADILGTLTLSYGLAPQLIINPQGNSNAGEQFQGTGTTHPFELVAINNDTFRLLDKNNGDTLFNADQSNYEVNFPQGLESTSGGNITTNGGSLPTVTCNGGGTATTTANSTLSSGSIQVGSSSTAACTMTFATACANALNCMAEDSSRSQALLVVPQSTSSVKFGSPSGVNALQNDLVYWICECN